MNIFQVLIRILEYNFFYIKTKKKDGSIKKENRLPFYSTIACSRESRTVLGEELMKH